MRASRVGVGRERIQLLHAADVVVHTEPRDEGGAVHDTPVDAHEQQSPERRESTPRREGPGRARVRRGRAPGVHGHVRGRFRGGVRRGGERGAVGRGRDVLLHRHRAQRDRVLGDHIAVKHFLMW